MERPIVAPVEPGRYRQPCQPCDRRQGVRHCAVPSPARHCSHEARPLPPSPLPGSHAGLVRSALSHVLATPDPAGKAVYRDGHHLGPAPRPRRQLLAFHAEEQPLALQLGGSDPAELARCAELAQHHGFVEVNLNCGCPSDRVRSGAFGACLMAEPARVAEGVRAMQQACDLPVTVKHRIGIDDQDSEQALTDFVGTLVEAGCRTVIVHARKAWLQGLSPRENRHIPPLDYERVYRLKKQFPELTIVLNGGLNDWATVARALAGVDGVMLGRAAYQNPWLLAEADASLFGDPPVVDSRDRALEQLFAYTAEELRRGTRVQHITGHQPGRS